ncbi:MAG: hypothetical protein EHM70_17740 [Chloroflexota bacterium]|nr:MAG: hypothetical protein EHM70_17740 [Chloroflexota bacterium]
METITKLKLILIFLMLAIIGAIFLFQTNKSVAENDPVAIIRQFTGKSNLSLEQTSNMASPLGEQVVTYNTTDKRWLFTVDTASYQVLSAIMPPVNPSTKQSISRDDAYNIAKSFISERIDGFDKLELIDEGSIDHGAGGIVFSFSWAEQLGSQKAMGFHCINIDIDAGTGAVTNYIRLPPVPVTIDVEPKISRDEAIAIAQEQFKTVVTSSDAQLSLWWKDNDRSKGQVLRWEVSLTSDDPIMRNKIYHIDAYTGTILNVFGANPVLTDELPPVATIQEYVEKTYLKDSYQINIDIFQLNQGVTIQDSEVITEFIQLLLDPSQEIEQSDSSGLIYDVVFVFQSKSTDGQRIEVAVRYDSIKNEILMFTSSLSSVQYSGRYSVPETFGKKVFAILNAHNILVPNNQ